MEFVAPSLYVYFAGARNSRAAPAKLNGVRNDSNKNQLVKMSHRPLKARGAFCRALAPRFTSFYLGFIRLANYIAHAGGE